MKIFKFIRIRIRYFGAIFVVIASILISKNFFINNTITSDDCQKGKCNISVANANLSDKEPLYFINDIFNSSNNEYYRLTFKQTSNLDTDIIVGVTTAMDEKQVIKNMNFKKSTDGSIVEIVFKTEGKYTDLSFEKADKNDAAQVFISNTQISKLNISNDNEYAQLKPTISGEIDSHIADQAETIDSRDKFSQLKEKGMILGQIFKSDMDYITGVKFDIDVTSDQTTDAAKKYHLELRKIDFDGESVDITSEKIFDLGFSVKNLDKYRQSDGKILFPIFAPIEKDKYYFIGINNDKVEVNKFNYLTLRGVKNKKEDNSGMVAVKNNSQTFIAPGSLYLITYGAKFIENDGTKILSNSIIEDLGKGAGLFTYMPKNALSDLIDVYSYSSDIKFDEEKRIITGKSIADSSVIYKFDTIYPFNRLRISGEQADPLWNKVDLAYSFDQKGWKEISSLDDESVQRFKNELTFYPSIKEIFIKISPVQNSQENENKYGLKDFKVEADLIIK